MTPGDPSAVERLDASRARLRLALSLNNPVPLDASARSKNYVETVLALRTRLGELATVCHVVAKATIAPVAQKHPWALVVGAFGLGGLLVFVRPWNWISGPAWVSQFLPTAPQPSIEKLRPKQWHDLLLPLVQWIFAPRQ
jgi:hypothetical protein